MKVVEVKLYQFSELSAKAKEKAKEWLQSMNIGDETDADAVWEHAKAMLALMGFSDTKYGYRGFWSQGDGAHIRGWWSKSLGTKGNYGRIHAIKDAAPEDVELQRIAGVLDAISTKVDDEFTVKITQSGMYAHENTMVFTYDGEPEDWYSSDAMSDRKLFEDACRDFARWLYKSLEEEHNYRNSDQQIAETMEANEYDFLENGRRFDG